jgi:succinyl-CoA synthetase beta subunit
MVTVVDKSIKSRTVVRLRGNNEEDAARMLRLAGFNVQLDLDEACLQAVRVRT